MKKTETIAQEALRLLKDIPEEEWITDYFTNLKSKCCVIGHYTRLNSENPNDYLVTNCNDRFSGKLRKYTTRFMKENKRFYRGNDISDINNGELISLQIESKELKSNETYKKVGPKQRVILFLEWMVKEGW